jgi:integrase
MQAYTLRAGSVRGEMIYQRPGSPYWNYDFTIDNQRYRGTTKQTTNSRAREFESQLLAQFREEGPIALRKRIPTLREFEKLFRKYVQDHNKLAPKSKAYYFDGMRLLLETSLASKRIDQIQKSHIETLELKGSHSWKNCALRTLRRMLSQAKEWRLIKELPKIPLFEQRERREVFSSQVEQAIIAEARQPLRDIFTVMMDTGCRPNEILQLRWEHIMWDQRVIFICKGKTKKSIRHVPLSDRTRDCLRRRGQDQGDSGYIFPSTRRSAGHYSIGSCDKEFRRVREKLGLPNEAVLYLSRHSFATSLLDATGNIKLVADTLGHSGTEITSTYLHPSTRGLTDVINLRNQQRSAGVMAQNAAQSVAEDSCGMD